MGIFSPDPEKAWSEAFAALEAASRKYAETKAQLEARLADAPDPDEIAGQLAALDLRWNRTKPELERRCAAADAARTRARQAAARATVEGHIKNARDAAGAAKADGSKKVQKALRDLLKALGAVAEHRERATQEVRRAHAAEPSVFLEVAEATAADCGTRLGSRRGIMGAPLAPLPELIEVIRETSAYLDPVSPEDLKALEGLLVELREAAGAKERAAREKAFRKEQAQAENERRAREAAERLARDREEAAAR